MRACEWKFQGRWTYQVTSGRSWGTFWNRWTHGLSVIGINNRRAERRYKQGIYNWITSKEKHISEWIIHCAILIKSARALHKHTNTHGPRSDPRALSPGTAQDSAGAAPDTFVNSPQQDVMILMTGSHHGGHVSQQETSEVKHVPSLLINSLATCCHFNSSGYSDIISYLVLFLRLLPVSHSPF